MASSLVASSYFVDISIFVLVVLSEPCSLSELSPLSKETEENIKRILHVLGVVLLLVVLLKLLIVAMRVVLLSGLWV